MQRPSLNSALIIGFLCFGALATVSFLGEVRAQEVVPAPAPENPAQAPAFPQTADEAINAGQKKVEEIARDLDQSQQAGDIKEGILNPIYQAAEYMSHPWFHWIAFALMTAGVVSFTLQLVLAKLAVLARMSISLSEILSDLMTLAICVVGLVLTTQAATENSNFTQHNAQVLSAAGAGAIVGLLHYIWGQRQEVQAAQGRKVAEKVIVKK